MFLSHVSNDLLFRRANGTHAVDDSAQTNLSHVLMSYRFISQSILGVLWNLKTLRIMYMQMSA